MNPVETLRRVPLVLVLVVSAVFLPLSAAHAAPPLQVALCLNAPAAADPTPTVCISNVIVAFNGKSEENRFHVSWRTQNAVSGRVRLTDGTILDDERGSNYVGTTHYVLVNDLSPRTTYTFDIISDGQTYTNGAAHWSVRLGDAAQEPIPYIIFGHVNNPDGTEADGTLVFALVRDRDSEGTTGPAGLLSTRVAVADGGNLFNINLANARTPDFASAYTFNPENDRVLITALGEQGRASKQFVISEVHPPAPPVTLNLSESGEGDAATATPTLIPPTATPTLTPTPTDTATPEPSSTETDVPPSRTRRAQPTATPTLVFPTATLPAEKTAAVTLVAQPAGPVQTERTRVFGGIPSIQPPPPAGNNLLLYVALAAVLFVGAILLGLAAFFVSRR